MAFSTIGMNLNCEPCKVRAFGDIGAIYMPIGDVTQYTGRAILIQNHTDAMLWFSFDGIDDDFPMVSGDKFILDLTSNSSMNNPLLLTAGSSLFVKQLGVPTTGSVYLTVFYGE
jgi:hypothetical protein